MPRVNPLTENERLNKQFRISLMAHMAADNISYERLAEMIGISLNTLYRRRDDPGKLTMQERRILKKIFPGIEIE